MNCYKHQVHVIQQFTKTAAIVVLTVSLTRLAGTEGRGVGVGKSKKHDELARVRGEFRILVRQAKCCCFARFKPSWVRESDDGLVAFNALFPKRFAHDAT